MCPPRLPLLLLLAVAPLLAPLLAPLGAQQTTPAPREGPRLAAGTRVLRDLEYVPGGGQARSLDLYLPPSTGRPRALVVWVHGGAWRGGSKAGNPAVRLMEAGFATASVEYRFSQQAKFPAQIEDCKAAIRFLRARAQEFELDPAKFGVWGSSAGGHLVALLGTAGDVADFEGGPHPGVSSRVQAVCNWFGPANLLTMAAQSAPGSPIDHDAPEAPEALLIGGPVQQHAEKARAASPVNYVSPDDAPFLIIHGDRDPVVPLRQSEELHAALQKAGVESRLHVIKGAGHGGPGFNTSEVRVLVRDFFLQHLGAKPPQ